MNEHTKTPWKVNNILHIDELAFGYVIANRTTIARIQNKNVETCQADTAFIVRACNAHDELLEACKMAHEFIGILENKLDRPETFMIAQFSPILAKLHAIIAKAKGVA